MYKQKMQELCQKNKWDLPKYSTSKYGLDHCPSFKSSISVNGFSFISPSPSPSSKQSQNHAARIAFLHFTSTSPNQAGSQSEEAHQEANSNDDRCNKQLKNYAHWKNLDAPYFRTMEEPSHPPRYTTKVVIDGRTFETPQSFSTSTEAENACAEMALLSIIADDFEEGNPSFYKNLLMELAKKEGISKPLYETTSIGAPHAPIFYSFVKIYGEKFHGKGGRCKKAAESNAAKVAYLYLEQYGKNYSTWYDCAPTEIPNGVCDSDLENEDGTITDKECVSVGLGLP